MLPVSALDLPFMMCKDSEDGQYWPYGLCKVLIEVSDARAGSFEGDIRSDLQ